MPMLGRADSLNAAVAAAVMAFRLEQAGGTDKRRQGGLFRHENNRRFPLLALALTACDPYYGTGNGQPYPQGPQGTRSPAIRPTPTPGIRSTGPPMPPGGPVYPGPGQPTTARRRPPLRPARRPIARSAPSPSGTWKSAAT